MFDIEDSECHRIRGVGEYLSLDGVGDNNLMLSVKLAPMIILLIW
jgi:hypothetical protein